MATQLNHELLDEYKNRVMPALREKHGYKNLHQIPKMEKVVINTSVGAAVGREAGARRREGRAGLDHRPAADDTRAKKSIANFKLRQDQAIGAKVTLRGGTCMNFSSV